MASETPKQTMQAAAPVSPSAAPAASTPARPVAARPTTPPPSSAAPKPAAPASKAATATSRTLKPSFELPPAVYSPQLLESVIYDIERYLEWYRQGRIQKRVGAHTAEEPTHSAETVLVIESWLAGKPATLESLEALLEQLRSLKLAQIHIMLAALPNRAQREALVTWFRTNVGPHLLLSFVADRNLGGGVVVRTPNRVFDYTWKQQLIAGRGKLAEILKRV